MPTRMSGATTSDPAPIVRSVPERRCSRWANAWSDSARSGSMPAATISAIGSDSTMSMRSKAATTASSGDQSAGAVVASRT